MLNGAVFGFVIHHRVEPIAPRADAGRFENQGGTRWAAVRGQGDGRGLAAVVEADDDRLAAAVEIKITRGVAHRTVQIQAAEDAFIIAKVVDRDRFVDGSARSGADESSDRSRHSGNRAHTAGDLFNIDAREGRRNWHGSPPEIDG